MNRYLVKEAIALSNAEIVSILEAWNISAWKPMTASLFRERFARSEFHLLVSGQDELLSVARINFSFQIKVLDSIYSIPEFVGFASVVTHRGYGSGLLKNMMADLKERNIVAVGFCEKELRSFYQKMNIRVFYNKAAFLREKNDLTGSWTTSADDDILDINLSEKEINIITRLSNNEPGYLL